MLRVLTWEHINWETGRITVPSPKTEHLHGGESRVAPIFPELRPYLEDMFELAEPGNKYVITRYPNRTNTNLGPQLKRIIRRAGLKPWSNPFRNLRSTRETELARVLPLHVVCDWIGNTPSVAMSNYLRVTDEDFEQALSQPSQAVQNPVQQPAVLSRSGSQTDSAADEKTPVLQGFASECDYLHESPVVPTGFEPVTSRM